jgi:2-polyprenyl-3-methyl-5-hydroxy-6-metoxy-1,4-benzoquinol methylase
MRAYENYYTHASPQSPSNRVDWRARLENGYVNARFGLCRQPASPFGPWVFAVLPVRRSAIDREHRHLPPPGPDSRLLDVGCGDGRFLAIARDCGWAVTGLEPDPVAADRARQRDLDVRVGGLEALADESSSFDAITLSHVIEHVHEPLKTLQDCYRLLRPSGRIWIETPNLESLGHLYFGEHWRGLEAPRHLVMFALGTLRFALTQTGFEGLRIESTPSSRESMFSQSESIRRSSRTPLGEATERPLARQVARSARWGHLCEQWFGGSREFLTLSARRPW